MRVPHNGGAAFEQSIQSIGTLKWRDELMAVDPASALAGALAEAPGLVPAQPPDCCSSSVPDHAINRAVAQCDALRCVDAAHARSLKVMTLDLHEARCGVAIRAPTSCMAVHITCRSIPRDPFVPPRPADGPPPCLQGPDAFCGVSCDIDPYGRCWSPPHDSA